MNQFTRREFLRTAGLLSAVSTSISFDLIKTIKPKLSFSTLGCPDWTFKAIIDFAVANGYQGLEMRGLQREMELTKCPEFHTRKSILATKQLMDEKGLKFVNLGSSTHLHNVAGPERTKQIDDGKQFIDLAKQLACPYVRVFPNNLPKDQDRNETLDLIIKGLIELGDYAKSSGVKVLMETHGDVVYAADIEKVMKGANHPHVGLVWDVLNMWSITKEAPVTVYEKLKPYIYHAHIKNATIADGKISYVLLNKGEAPIFEAIDALANGGYKGYYSFEWEKMWHPEIADPEIALADYPKAMVAHFNP